MRRSIRLKFFLLPLLFAGTRAHAQTVPDSTIKKIDSLFSPWNNPNSPGCTIGVVRNDSLIYAKGYGMANLEYGIANTPETIFHMASISKQFTAYSIVLLARQGKLGLDDDIHKYLGWFPDLKQKITIRNLLNHTSGIRDQWSLLAISGTRLDDVITQEHIVKILAKQQALNFKPGEMYSYSNSGFTMLAEIIRSVTGQSLRKFTDSAIFKPLGMAHTHFHDDYTEIEKNRAYSYDKDDSNHFSNAILSYSNAGATSLFTNIDDMSKWVMNFYHTKVGDQKDINELTRKGKLNDGSDQDYALGIQVDIYKGWKMYTHSGADAGYRTNISILPDLKMGFIVFSNEGDFRAGRKTDAIADLFVKDTAARKSKPAMEKKDSTKAILKETASLQKFAGSYISMDGNRFSFLLKDKKMYWDPGDGLLLMIKTTKDSFAVFNFPEVKFVFRQTGNDTTADAYSPGNHLTLSKYMPDTNRSDSMLRTYTGTYYSPELDCKYGIMLKDHALVLTNDKYNDAKLTMAGDDHLINDFWWMSHLVMTRDADHKITGFEINAGRVMHLQFRKIE